MASATLVAATFDMVGRNVTAQVVLDVQGRSHGIQVDLTAEQVVMEALSKGRQEWQMIDVATLATAICGFTVNTVPDPTPAQGENAPA